MQVNRKLTSWVQALSLTALVVLLAMGRLQWWMAVFAVSLVMALRFGRLYCGLVCPLNTAMALGTRARKALAIEAAPVPEWAKTPVLRWGIAFLFVSMSILAMRGDGKVPVKPLLIVLGLLFTLRYTTALWHRYLCPYGTILSIPAAQASTGYRVDKEYCNNCGFCIEICPGDAIIREENQPTPIIHRSLCLVCGDCVNSCPHQAINWN